MKITLLRHGKPDFDWQRNIKGNDLGNLQKTYDAAGIVGSPSEASKDIVNQHSIVVCSDLPRSLQSAEILGVTTPKISDPIFRESPLPYFDSISLKLPVPVWVAILRGLWFLGFSKNAASVSSTKDRAAQASEQLIELAYNHNSVLLVGHGMFNHYVAKELLRKNWLGSSNSGRKYWTFSTYLYQNT